MVSLKSLSLEDKKTRKFSLLLINWNLYETPACYTLSQEGRKEIKKKPAGLPQFSLFMRNTFLCADEVKV